MTDDEIIQKFMAHNMPVFRFVEKGLSEGWLTPVKALGIKDQLMKVSKARHCKSMKYVMEKYLCDQCDLPHKLVFKHDETDCCPACLGGLEYGDQTAGVSVCAHPFVVTYLGSTSKLMNTVIHSMTMTGDGGIPQEFTEEEMNKLRMEILEVK